MNIEITCPSCNGPQRVPRAAIGTAIKCYHCGSKLEIAEMQSGVFEAVLLGQEVPEEKPAKAPKPLRWADRPKKAVRFNTDEEDEEDLEAEASDLRRQRLFCQIFSFVFGVPGLGLGVAAYFQAPPLRTLLGVLGGLSLCIGIAFAVAYKRYRVVDAFLGLLPVVGLLVLALLADEKGQQLSRLQKILDRRAERDERRIKRSRKRNHRDSE
jgi:hypothetical protein